jgi:hypothetical protein
LPRWPKAAYHGETAWNLYTRGREHENNLINKTEKSFMLKHIKEKHPNSFVSYTAKVMATARDCITRQVRETVHLRRCSPSTTRLSGIRQLFTESRDICLEDENVRIICVSVTN